MYVDKSVDGYLVKDDSDTSVFLKYIPFGEVIGPVKLEARIMTI